MRKYARKDKAHNSICDFLEAAGMAVLDLSGLGKGVPDAAVWRGDKCRLLEFKSKYGKLTPDQIAWRKKNPRLAMLTHEVKTIKEALHVMGFK
jgi:hypothetical protein